MNRLNNSEEEQPTVDGLSVTTRASKWLHLNDEHPLLPLSIRNHVTVPILLNFLGVVLLVAVGFDTLKAAFVTNVPLNGLIVTIMLIGVLMSVVANLKLWGTGLFLSRLEAIAQQSRISGEELDKLELDLKRKASIVDCKNMQNLIDNLKSTGALNVNDSDARMIKSKLGARVNRGRSKVNFLGGLLVMLGLLGTFLGLLGTIDAVGEAMAGMASIGSDSSDGEGGGMSGFISSLAAPLQGMGLAFSSSLFGLSGSLLVGTFQYFSSAAQDHFIESVSRWLDEQIPGLVQANKAAGRAKNSPPVADTELKAWIVGFIQTSQNTQREMADVVDAILVSSDASSRAIELTERVISQQDNLVSNLASLNSGVVAMIEHQKRLDSALNSEFTQSLLESHQTIGSRMESLDSQFSQFTHSHSRVVDGLEGLTATLNEQLPHHLNHTTEQLAEALGQIDSKLASLSSQDRNQVEQLADQIKRLGQLVLSSERRSAQRDLRVQSDLQNQFRRESDILKKTIGDNLTDTVHKDVIPFIAREQRELQKLTQLIDRQYGRRRDDKKDPGENAA